MSVLNKLASALNRNDEVPNQKLAQEIAAASDTTSARELVANLSNADKAIQSDCIKVLYEIGSINPTLIAPFATDFVDLLHSRNNRLVWGGMSALGAIADQTADDLWKQIDVIIKATDKGSAITQDWGIRVLAVISHKNISYEKRIFPFLKTFLQNCPAKDLPRHAESALVAVNAENRGELRAILEGRKASLKEAQAKRITQVIKKIDAL